MHPHPHDQRFLFACSEPRRSWFPPACVHSACRIAGIVPPSFSSFSFCFAFCTHPCLICIHQLHYGLVTESKSCISRGLKPSCRHVRHSTGVCPEHPQGCGRPCGACRLKRGKDQKGKRPGSDCRSQGPFPVHLSPEALLLRLSKG